MKPTDTEEAGMMAVEMGSLASRADAFRRNYIPYSDVLTFIQ